MAWKEVGKLPAGPKGQTGPKGDDGKVPNELEDKIKALEAKAAKLP